MARPCSHWLVTCSLLALAIVIADSSPSHAQGRKKKKGDDDAPPVQMNAVAWRHDLQAALAEAEAVGKPVFADFYATWCGPCKQMLATTMTDPKVIALLNTEFIPVKVDVDVDNASQQKYEVRSMPTLFFLKPSGEVAHKVVGAIMDPDTFVQTARKGAEMVGPLTPPAEADRVKNAYKTAMKALAKKNFGTAYEMLTKIVETSKAGVPEVDQAKTELENLTKQATARLDEVRGLADKKEYASLAQQVEEVISEYNGMPVAEEARKLRDDLLNDPEAKLAIRTAAAEKLYSETQEDLKEERFSIALTRLEGLAGDYADLPLGTKIKDELTKLKSDPKIVEQVRDEVARTQCNAWLSLARTWSKNATNQRAVDKAKGYYQKVIATFPETSFSKMAKEEMSKLAIRET